MGFPATDHRRGERYEDGRRDVEPPRGVSTGTTVVGLAGADGVVLAADARASLGGRFVTNRSMRKVEPIGETTAVAFSGGVSDAQSLVDGLRTERRLYELEHDRPASTEALARAAAGRIRAGHIRSLWLLFGGYDDGPVLAEVGVGGGVMPSEYAATGSGMQLAYGALERSFEPDLPVTDLRPIAANAVAAAAERDTASGDGTTIATIFAGGIDLEQFDGLGADALAGNGRSDADLEPFGEKPDDDPDDAEEVV